MIYCIYAVQGTYAEKIQGHFCDTGNIRQIWHGFQALTDYKSRQGVSDDDASLIDRLNNFFAQKHQTQQPEVGLFPLHHLSGPALIISATDTRRTLTRVNPRKAGGLDNIPGCVLRTCAGELAGNHPQIL